MEADAKHPNFAGDFERMEKRLSARFEALELNLHQEAVQNLQVGGGR